MGRGHGSSRGSGPGATMGATERGYSQTLAKAVQSREDEIRNSPNERLSLFNESGKEIFRNDKGGEHGVSYPDELGGNAIVTHNHPSGRSFSDDDVFGSVTLNGKEIRAVTSDRTYSLKRPKEGWGVSGDAAQSRYKQLYFQNISKASKYVKSYTGDKQVATRRAYGNIEHTTMKQLSKEFGWEYTTKRRQ